jgi:type IV secretory pathway VirB2 component (pilin)
MKSILKSIRSVRVSYALAAMPIVLMPLVASASVESSLQAVQTKLINVILPLVGIVGLAIAGISFLMGSQNARSHLVMGIIGAVVGFGAPSIISFIQSLIH